MDELIVLKCIKSEDWAILTPEQIYEAGLKAGRKEVVEFRDNHPMWNKAWEAKLKEWNLEGS